MSSSGDQSLERRMRILLVSVRADHGGGPRHMELLLRYFPSELEAYVACPDEPPYGARFQALTRGRVFSIPHRRFALREALALASYVRAQGIDVIHTHGKGAGPYGRVAAMLTGKPCLHTPHGVHIGQYGALTKMLYRLYENITGFWVRRLVFVSEEERESAQRFGLWRRKAAAVVVNGVPDVAEEERRELRSTARRKLDIPEGKVVVATVSRFDFAKNMAESLEVAKAVPEAVFLWLGDGEEASALKEDAGREGIGNVQFLGWRDDSLEILAASDIYLTTSRWEGLPLAVLEAMAMGLPVVASDVTGHRELIGGSGGGLLYPLHRPSRAASAITQLARDPDLRHQLGRQGQLAQRRHYSAAHMARAVSRLYRDACEADGA